ncbi:MAG TPA: hypothetical protein VHB69_13000 [Mycobacteriales bacterium]|nr:hypothetical protein [Mycobacteriales bacterium]
MNLKIVGVSAVLVGLAATACSSSSTPGSAAPQSTTPSTQPAAASPSSSPTAGATDLTLTAAVRAELIHAYAQEERLPDSAYTGLAKGTAYYAVDDATGIHWAGAGLIPSDHSLRAQVSVQDDGGYILFEQRPDGTWKLWAVGLEGTPESQPCPVSPPADVLAIWHWSAGSCNPYMKASATSPSPATSAAATAATNLALTQDVRQQLVDAKAAEVHVADTAFTGLAKGTAYYAVDNHTGIFWAGATVLPSKRSLRAQVSTQDEGAYDIFEKPPGGRWQVYDTGLDGPGPRTGSACPVTIPADVLAVWHWQPDSCDPPVSP